MLNQRCHAGVLYISPQYLTVCSWTTWLNTTEQCTDKIVDHSFSVFKWLRLPDSALSHIQVIHFNRELCWNSANVSLIFRSWRWWGKLPVLVSLIIIHLKVFLHPQLWGKYQYNELFGPVLHYYESLSFARIFKPCQFQHLSESELAHAVWEVLCCA